MRCFLVLCIRPYTQTRPYAYVFIEQSVSSLEADAISIAQNVEHMGIGRQ
jgi:hypothetical protein